ncbi:MAG: hypothetical protein HY026_07150 [Deltaproteobacteria bacterium]|nr:hypothetical protein [Deltaproteobacteria bacterium]
MIWTDLTVMVYVVPFIIAALVLLFVADFFSLASIAAIHCPVCRKRFRDVFVLRKHMKCAEGMEKGYPRAA